MTKKEKEYAAVSHLLNEYGLSVIERKEQERPDFVCSNKDGIVIGIEVTEVRDKSKSQIEETERVVDSLLKEYTESRRERFCGMYSVRINQSKIHNGEHFRALKKELFEELDTILSGESSGGIIVVKAEKYSSDILIVLQEPGHFTTCRQIPAYWLDEAISAKNKKLIEYDSLPENQSLRIREYWLVISVPLKEGWDLTYAHNYSIRTGYSRVYLFDGFGNKRIV